MSDPMQLLYDVHDGDGPHLLLVHGFLMSRAFARHLIAQGDGGAIINISSVAGKALPPRATAYAASKAGIQALTAGMAVELGPMGIRVNALCPGFVDTSRMDVEGVSHEDRVNEAAGRNPLRRAADGQEIGTMAAFPLVRAGLRWPNAARP